jgi:uncharacterized membrane protein YhaH (DUF805 family)
MILITLLSVPGEIYLNPQAYSLDVPSVPIWPETLWTTFWLIPTTALMVKRFNDRDWSWWSGYAVAVILLLADLAPHFGFLIDPAAALPNAIVFWMVLVVLLATIVDNGFLRGTAGPNRYGPDPVVAGGPVAATV